MTLSQRKGYKTFSEVQQSGGSQFAPEQQGQEENQPQIPQQPPVPTQVQPQVQMPPPQQQPHVQMPPPQQQFQDQPVQRMRPPSFQQQHPQHGQPQIHDPRVQGTPVPPPSQVPMPPTQVPFPHGEQTHTPVPADENMGGTPVPTEEPLEVPFDDDISSSHQGGTPIPTGPPPQGHSPNTSVATNPKTKSNVWMWVGLGTIFVILVVGGGYMWYASSSGPEGGGGGGAKSRRRTELPPVNPAFKNVSSVKAW